MTLVMISIPLMVVAVAIAALPLILMSYAEHRRHPAETVRHDDRGTAQRTGDESAPLAA
jgi:hypothetical protein